jgi:predicted GIY-YIG superfamily endonuclease
MQAVYILHFSQPFKHARHYTGLTTNLPHRMAQHRYCPPRGLMKAIKAAGISFTLTRVFEGGDRSLEYHLKHAYKKAPQLCPLCNPRLLSVARPGPCITTHYLPAALPTVSEAPPF